MCDNIDTRRVLETLRELVVGSNAYIEKMRVGEPGVNRQLLKNVATYITRIFDTLGLIAKGESVGFPSSASGAEDLETLVMPHLEANISRFVFTGPRSDHSFCMSVLTNSLANCRRGRMGRAECAKCV